MTDDGGIRASYHDRESTAGVLREAYVVGQLDLPELRERSGAAYSARTRTELRRLTADLPAEPAWEPVVTRRCPPGQGPPPGRRAPGRPFAPLFIMAVIWLVIAGLANAPQALTMPLILLAGWALCTAGRRAPAAQPGHPDHPGQPVHPSQPVRPGQPIRPGQPVRPGEPGWAATPSRGTAGRPPATRCRARARRPGFRCRAGSGAWRR